MIFDEIQNLKKYKNLIPHFNSIEKIVNTNLTNLKEGSYQVQDGLRYIVSKYTSQKDKPFEVHYDEIDLQIIIEGEEKMEIGKPILEIQKYDKETDCALSSGYTTASLKAATNTFVIFYPNEYHKPGITYSDEKLIKKIIFKIKK